MDGMDEMENLRAELAQLRKHCDDQGAELQRLTRRNVTVLPYREKKLRKYSGAEPFEEWEADAQAAISGCGLTIEEQTSFLFNKLEGDAKREILCRGGPTRLTPEQLIKALEEVFTKKGLVPRLLSKFWARDQLSGESLAAYSHALMELLERITKADPNEVQDECALLLKKFCAGVADPNLRWELKQQLKAKPRATFIELRETALRWAEECAPRGTTSKQVATTAAVDAEQSLALDVLLKMKDDLSKVADQLAKQQGTLEQQAAAISALQKTVPSTAPAPRCEHGQGRVPQRAYGGSGVVCYYCQKPGHMKKDCQKRRRDDAARLPPQQQQGFQQDLLQ